MRRQHKACKDNVLFPRISQISIQELPFSSVKLMKSLSFSCCDNPMNHLIQSIRLLICQLLNSFYNVELILNKILELHDEILKCIYNTIVNGSRTWYSFMKFYRSIYGYRGKNTWTIFLFILYIALLLTLMWGNIQVHVFIPRGSITLSVLYEMLWAPR